MGGPGLRGAGVAVLLSLSCLPAALAQTADSGWNIVSVGAGQCLEAADSRAGSAVLLVQCGNVADRPFQTWTVQGDQYVNVVSGLCLDVAEARPGGPVVVETCEAPSQRPYQSWTVSDNGREVNPATGLCLDAGGTGDVWQAVLEPCGDDVDRPFQRWLALSLVGPVGSGAAAQGDAAAPGSFAWRYQRNVAPDVFDTRLSVTYGIPETDAYQANLTCQIGNSGPYALVELGADMGGLAGGQAVDFSVTGDGYAEVIEGNVLRAQEGIEGVEFAVALDSRFLAALRDLAALRYSVPGQPEVVLPLDGAGIPMLEFLSDCAGIGDLSTVGTTVSGGAVTGGDFGCAGLDGLRTIDSATPQLARFENRTDGYRVVNWVDGEGRQIEYGALNPGEVMEINTYLTHPWVITDGPGNCLQVIEITAGVETYPLDAPNRDFGSE